MKYWHLIDLHLPNELVSIVEHYLQEQGAVAINTKDAENHPILEPLPGEHPLWPTTKLCATFEASICIKEIHQKLIDLLPQKICDTINVSTLNEENWIELWYKDTKPIMIGDSLCIAPKHQSLQSLQNKTIIRLDPGLAFGTGQHPTTQLCLQWLEQSMPQNARVIDFGCGSGILSIAALLLGAKHCDAIDIDPQAINASQNNASYNGVAQILSCHLNTQVPEIKADIVMANIISSVLIDHAKALKTWVKPGGTMVLSGLLEEQVDSVVETFTESSNFSVHQQDGWCLLAIPSTILKK